MARRRFRPLRENPRTLRAGGLRRDAPMHVSTSDEESGGLRRGRPAEVVARLMRDKGVGCVVCLREGRVAGIVTDRQLAAGALAEGPGAGTPVEDVMTADGPA